MNTNLTASCRPVSATRGITMRALLVGFLGLWVAVAASARDKPRIISFDAPGAVDTGCFSDCAVTINNWGEVTGSYLDANNVFHGFVRSPNGRLTTFEAPGADTTPNDFNGTFPNSINDAGVITGFYVDANNVSHGFVRSTEGAFTTVDVPDYSGTTPISLNLEGAIVGFASDQNGVFHGFVRHPDGRFETWIGPGGCNASPATGCFGTGAFSINLFGIIAGGYEDNSGNFVDHGLVRSAGGKFTVFNAPGAGNGSYQGTGCPGCSVAMNQFGAIASFTIDANNATHGYLRSPRGEITTFDVPGEGSFGLGCSADCSIGLNDFGFITGSYLDANNVFHGFVRSPDGKFLTFDAPGADLTANDFNGTFPVSINDAGIVSGFYIDANNVFHSFLLLP